MIALILRAKKLLDAAKARCLIVAAYAVRAWNSIDFIEGCILAVCLLMVAAGIWGMP